MDNGTIWQLKPHEADADYSAICDVSTTDWQQGKTAGGWKDSIQAHAKAVVVTVTIRQLFTTWHAYNSLKPRVAVPADDKDQQKNAREAREKRGRHGNYQC